MASQDTVGQRFVQLIAHLGISKNAFAISLGKTATVIQHLVDERNKPGFDLLDKVFEVYPNVSMAWLMKGVGPMLVDDSKQPTATTPDVQPASISEKKTAALKPDPLPAAEKTPLVTTITEKPAPAEEPSAPVAASRVPLSAAPAPAVAPVPTAAPVAPAPLAAAEAPAPTAADTSWQTALYTQQMAHQLALAELRNQHLQDQQRLMQQMMDLMQRQLAR